MAIYTQLSLVATPGRVYSFTAKSADGAGEKGEGLFTALSVLAVPGRRHIFLPKSIIVPVPEEPELIFDAGGGVTGRIQEDLYRWRQRDDEEIINIIMTIVLSGRL
jgi:hypothetical protein